MTDQEKTNLLGKATQMLGEEFDCVQILVSWNEQGLTKRKGHGSGNWYARQGMCHEFIQMDIAEENAKQISAKINPPDEGDSWKAINEH